MGELMETGIDPKVESAFSAQELADAQARTEYYGRVASWSDRFGGPMPNIKPPRAPHPVFGPVPRGWAVVHRHHDVKDGDKKEAMVNLREAKRVEELKTGCAIFFSISAELSLGPSEKYLFVDESAAEVSRLIAEAQGDE